MLDRCGNIRSESPDRPAVARRLVWLAVTVLCFAYLATIVRLSPYPAQDYPNHLTRAVIIADQLFHHSVQFGQQYLFHFLPVPYVLHDLLLVTCVELFGPRAGADVFTALALLSFPLAVTFYLSVNRLAPRARPLVFLVCLYLSTDWFFVMGFLAFRLAMSLIVAALALIERLRTEWSWPAYTGYVVIASLGYLTHLTAPVFVAVALAVSAGIRLLIGTTAVRRELALIAPVALLLVLHAVLVQPHDTHTPTAFAGDWGDWAQKVQDLRGELYRFGGRAADLFMVLLAICLVWPIRYPLRNWLRLRWPDARSRGPGWHDGLEPLVLAIAFLLMYFVLPRESRDATYVDVRALPMVTFCLVIACLRLTPEPDRGLGFATWPMLALAATLAVGNLAYLTVHGLENKQWLDRYRAIVADIPSDSGVFPVYTQQQTSVLPYVQAASFVTLDRHAVIPYLFGGDRGDPMKYFRYRHRPYMPDHWWYKTLADAGRPPELSLKSVDWARVAREYDYILVTVPYDGRYIPLATHTVAVNGSAALLAIEKPPRRR